MRADRRVHAFTPDWEIVRYDRAGKWYVEWCRLDEPPTCVRGWGTLLHWLNRRGRANLTCGQAARLAVGLDATIILDLPGGRTFDAHVRQLEDLT